MNKTSHTPLMIAILVPQFPNIVQTYVLNHILSLKNSGAKTVIIADQPSADVEIHPDVTKYKLLDETLYTGTDAKLVLRQLLSVPVTNRRYLSLVKRIVFSNIWIQRGLKYGIKSIIRARVLASYDISIAHSHSLFCSYDHLFFKDIFNIPMVATFHGHVPKNVKMLEAGKIKSVMETMDKFFVNTGFARKQLTELGCNPDKIVIIPQGTRLEDFPYTPHGISANKSINILSVGRLSIEKGFDTAIKAISCLAERYPNITYRIIGGGPEHARLQDLINRLNISDHVKLCGRVSTDKLAEYYAAADIFILPSIDLHDGSHTETQGVVLQEAQSSGIAVIASRTGGIPEVIHDRETGLLFDEKNHKQLADLIESLITDSSFYNKLCHNGRADVENSYSIDVICNRQMLIYNELVQNMPAGL